MISNQTFAGMIARWRDKCPVTHEHDDYCCAHECANEAQALLTRLRGLVDAWRDEDCNHAWAKKHANSDEPAEITCGQELALLLGPEQAPERTSR